MGLGAEGRQRKAAFPLRAMVISEIKWHNNDIRVPSFISPGAPNQWIILTGESRALSAAWSITDKKISIFALVK